MVARRLLELGDRVARRKFIMDLPPQLSSVVDRIGRLATGGGFWMGVAAALAVTGPRARRAARAGLVAYAASSAITNGPVKWASQRDRPRGVLLADFPRRGRRPRTSSLPSSHTADAGSHAPCPMKRSSPVGVSSRGCHTSPVSRCGDADMRTGPGSPSPSRRCATPTDHPKVGMSSQCASATGLGGMFVVWGEFERRHDRLSLGSRYNPRLSLAGTPARPSPLTAPRSGTGCHSRRCAEWRHGVTVRSKPATSVDGCCF
jgi:hypothetical protein